MHFPSRRGLSTSAGWLVCAALGYPAMGTGCGAERETPSVGVAGASGAAGSLGVSGSGSPGASGSTAASGASGAAPIAGASLGGSSTSGGAGRPAVSGAGGNGGAGAGGAAFGAGAVGSGARGGNASGAGAVAGASGGAPNAGSSGMSGSSGASGGGAPSEITVWLAGDSTVANGNTPCPVGWGAAFGALFDERVKVVNGAAGGRSVRTWLYEVGTTMDASGECTLARDPAGQPTLQSRWRDMLDAMKPGDYLFVQFGINDGSATCDRHVGIEAFQESYGMMAGEAKERGARPIFLTPVSAISCNGSTARGTRGAFVEATIQAGMEHAVPVIDLHELSVKLYTTLGFCPVPGGDVGAGTQGPVGEFFCDDHTHFDRPGAEKIADLIASSLGANGIPLAQYLRR